METVAATEGWRAGRASRWCSRFFVVLGGAVAGTAAAWVVTTSGAAAEPADDPIAAIAAEIGTQATAATLSTEVAGRADPVDSADALQERREVRSIEDDAEDVGAAATTMAATVCDLADHVVEQPCQRATDAVEQIVRDPKDAPQIIERTLTPSQEIQDLGNEVLGLLDPTTGADLLEQLPQLPRLPSDRSAQPAPPAPDTADLERADSGTGSPEIFTVEVPSAAQDLIGSAVDVRHSSGHLADDARGAGDDREGNAPVQPVRIPLAPLTAPVAPGGSHGASHLDGTTFGVSAGSSAASDDTALRQIRSGVRHLQVSPGAQPGVTPD